LSHPVRTVKKKGNVDVNKLHDLNSSPAQKKERPVEKPVHYGVPDEIYHNLKERARDDILKNKRQTNVVNIDLSAINDRKNVYNKSDRNNRSSV
jgi:hypothetical protein